MFIFNCFFSLGPGDVDIFFAVLILPPERLDKVRSQLFFLPPPASSGRPPDLIDVEAGQLAIHPKLTTNSENIVQDCQKAVAIIALIA
jgi:hypothetical protein